MSPEVVGTIVFGDLNVHHVNWLVHSGETTPSGRRLYEFCQRYGFIQTVRDPTREDNLLDLVLTDLNCLKSSVLPGVSDHKFVMTTASVSIPAPALCSRECWMFKRADWTGLSLALNSVT